jgi:chromosome segregation ATPase
MSYRELEQSNKIIKTLEDSNDKLKSGSIKLHEKIEDLESKAKAWDEEKMDIKKSYKDRIADVEDDYKAYRMTYRKSLKSLHERYISALNEMCAQCLPFEVKGLHVKKKSLNGLRRR